jgi:hypothetical protein
MPEFDFHKSWTGAGAEGTNEEITGHRPAFRAAAFEKIKIDSNTN